jgi:1-aminocyclopropane-1-carboxylate synthase
MTSYFEMFIQGTSDLYDATTNPDGYVLLAVAENRLAFPPLLTRITAASASPFDDSTGAYSNMRGRPALRQALASLYEQVITQGAPVDPERLVVATGVGALIAAMSFVLCDEGDVILLPTPTYGALYNDLGTLFGVRAVDCPLDQSHTGSYCLTEAVLECGLAAATQRVRALFLINPSNPLGLIHSVEEIRMAITWCRRHRIHCIIDESAFCVLTGDWHE